MNMAAPQTIDSPCIGICELDLATDLCRGCFRNRNEVAGWSTASDDIKRDILAKARERRAASKEGRQR